MTAQECLQILRDVKDVAFATVDENGFPQVRIIDVMLVEEGRLYFCTARGKDFHRQLTASGRVAVTGLNREYQMVRVSGKARKLPDQKIWIDRIFEKKSIHEGCIPEREPVYPGAVLHRGRRGGVLRPGKKSDLPGKLPPWKRENRTERI